MNGKSSGMEVLLKKLSDLEAERDYYRLVAERLGRKALSDAQDFSQMIRDLRQREAKLQQSQEELEKTIEERTLELVTRNRELSESTLRYDSLVKQIPHGVYTLLIRDSGTMQFEYLSPVFCHILDIDPGEVQRNSIYAFSIAHPDDREGLVNSLLEASRLRTPFRWEGRFLIRQETRWMRLEAGPTTTPIGDIIWNGVLSDITEWRLIQEKLKESEERLNFLVRNSSDNLVLINADGSQRYVSPAAERITGYPVSELEGRAFATLIHPDDLKNVTAAWNEAVENPEKTVTVQYRHIHKTQSWVYSEAIAQSFLDEPAINGVIASVRDITERKRAEEATLNSNKLLQTIINTAPVRIFFKDKELRYIGCNNIFAKDAGVKCPEDLIGKDDYQLAWKEQAELYRADDLRVIESGNLKLSYDEPQTTPKGDQIWLRTSKVPLRNESNEIIGVLGVYEDITEYKKVEADKTRLLLRLRAILDNLPMMAWLKDTDSRLEMINEPYAKACGLAVNECIGKTDLDLFPEKMAKAYMADDHEVCVSGQKKNAEEMISSPDGIKWHQTYKTPIYDENGLIVGTAGIAQDITDRKQAEEERARLQEQLIQAQKMESVGQLAGGVAHEFNNMLGVILGHAEMAMDQIAPADPLYGDLEQIRKAAGRSADITRQLLAFARKQIIAPKVLDLNETIVKQLKLLRRLIGENIDLLWKPESDLWTIKADQSQIDQILTNLCINARDAITGTGRITVKTGNCFLDDKYCETHAGYVSGEYVLISVSDTGCGIDKQTVNHIFEPFFTTKDVGQGTGLGLAMVYGAAKQNNGFVDVSSEPKQGTVFTIYLPRYLETGTTGEEAEEGVVTLAEGGRETILLVEDESSILQMTTRMLQGLGYSVLTASTPDEAIRLSKAPEVEIHLLITDVIMPEMNGRDLADRLLTDNNGMKCLFMSGYPSDIIDKQGLLVEGMHFIQKPFSKNELTSKIREMLD